MVNPLRIFIGFDRRETIAYHVLAHSLLSHASAPISIIPLVQSQLREQGFYSRPKDDYASTDFSLTRFLVPYLSDYTGISVFLDCDMLCRTDIYDLVMETYRSPRKWSVRVVQHDYTPSQSVKFLGAANYTYPRKNWSSVMLFNNSHEHCRRLTPEYVNVASPADLHRFNWTDDANIGALPVRWNHLVGEYPPNPDASLVHWTLGGPYFKEYESSEFSDEWFSTYHGLLSPLTLA